MSKLKELADFSNVFNQTELQDKYESLADYLVNHCEFSIYNEAFRVTKLEFFLFSQGVSNDNMHADKTQRKKLHFYVHQTGKAFKAGKNSGLDITFGGERSDGKTIFAGMLVRGIEFTNKEINSARSIGKIIPALIRNEDMNNLDGWSKSEYELLNQINDHSIFDCELIEFNEGNSNFEKLSLEKIIYKNKSKAA